MNTSKRRWMQAAAAGAAAVLLAGCASLGQFNAEVSTFGTWPADRSPGSYAFDRLPSQQANAEEAQALETAAAAALARAGFKPASTGSQPDVLVQVGARVSRADRAPWDDPLWWGGGFGIWRHGPWRGPYWSGSMRFESPRYEREVAVLIRERESGKPLYEAHASNEGYQGADKEVLALLFSAALKGFPAVNAKPTVVSVPYKAD
jgi:hypothetical protein